MSLITSNLNKRWPNGIVPFVIDIPKLKATSVVLKAISSAIAYWNDPINNLPIAMKAHNNESNYISFVLNPVPVFSGKDTDSAAINSEANQSTSNSVGMQGGVQFIICSYDASRANIIHEIGHAIGLFHEQNRQDRGNHVTIQYQNIYPLTIPNFVKENPAVSMDFGPYDFESRMHYGPFDDSMFPPGPTTPGRPSITVNIPPETPGTVIASSPVLTEGDKEGVRFMYREFISNVTSNPILLQSNNGIKGNFELITINNNKLLHIFRDNDSGSLKWHKVAEIDQPANYDRECSMFQSDLGANGNFEVLLRRDDKLYEYVFNNSDKTWHPNETPIQAEGSIISGVIGNPFFLENKAGTSSHPNFEMIVPLSFLNGGGIQHYFRDSSSVWHKGKLFAQHLKGNNPVEDSVLSHTPAVYSALTMIKSSLGNLEVIARAGSRLYILFRDNNSGDWSDANILKTQNGNPIDNVCGNPVLIQGNFAGGNFEMIVPVKSGGINHYSRDSSFQWNNNPANFASELGIVDYVTLIQSNFDNHFEVVASKNNRLYSYYRDSNFNWRGGNEIVLVR